MSDRPETTTARKSLSILLGGGHLAALWALALVQPLLSLLGSNPDFFVARDNTGGQIVAFVLLLTFLPPLAATAIEALINLVSPAARWAFHLVLVALLFSAIVLQFLKQFLDGPAWPMILFAVLAGVYLAWAYGYRAFLRSLTDILIPAPIVILVVFLFFSGASELATGDNEVEAIKTSIGNPAPIVMLVFDEFPAGSLMTPEGEVNAKRFPNFAELEGRSDWYRNTVTNASYTAIAVPAIQTGKVPDRSLLPTAADHPENLFTLLGGSYEVHAVEPITQLCPPSICETADEGSSTKDALSSFVDDLKYVSAHLTLPEAMGSSLPDISQSFSGFGNTSASSSERGRASRFVRDQLAGAGPALDGEGDINDFLAAIDPSEEETLDFVHVTEPHYPWTHYPDGRSYTQTTEDFRAWITETDWLAGPYLTDRARQAHLLETGFADHLLGRVISRLKQDGRWNESMFVVVADHGGAMTVNRNRREAEPDTIGEIATVPLFIKAPGQTKGKIINRPTCLTEVLFEMADRIDATVPWDQPGCVRTEVAIDNGTGPLVRSPMATVLSERQAYVDTLASLFGGNTGFSQVMKLGPNQRLIGTPLKELDLEPVSDGMDATPDNPGDTGTIWNPKSSYNPVLRQRGTLDGVPAGTALAVSVNGKVRAVGESYDESSRTLFTMLLPQTSLKPGPNEISVLRVDGSGKQTRLTPLWSSSDE
ncbi:MAG: sulfatase-like hydrolase/transferase [Solirubrobacterales bacterium]